MIIESTIEDFKNKLKQISPIDGDKEDTQFYKCPFLNLFYYRNLKAASTTYTTIFQQLGWQCSHIKEIDWQQDFIFGHILDPLTRFRKGVTEVFTYRNVVKEILKNLNMNETETARFALDLCGTCAIDKHTYTIYDMLKENAKKVYWIPVDIDFDHKKHTLELLDFFNAFPEPRDRVKNMFYYSQNLNISNEKKKQFYHSLCLIPPDDSLTARLDFDQCLYMVAKCHFLENDS